MYIRNYRFSTQTGVFKALFRLIMVIFLVKANKKTIFTNVHVKLCWMVKDCLKKVLLFYFFFFLKASCDFKCFCLVTKARKKKLWAIPKGIVLSNNFTLESTQNCLVEMLYTNELEWNFSKVHSSCLLWDKMWRIFLLSFCHINLIKRKRKF